MVWSEKIGNFGTCKDMHFNVNVKTLNFKVKTAQENDKYCPEYAYIGFNNSRFKSRDMSANYFSDSTNNNIQLAYMDSKGMLKKYHSYIFSSLSKQLSNLRGNY